MGYTRHHAFIVTSWKADRLAEARERAVEIFGPNRVTPILPKATNDFASFMVGPDGSKEGWDESDEGDEQRAEFAKLLRTAFSYEDGSSPIDWAEVQYGDDEGCNIIVGSDADKGAASDD